jgi:lipopolysaccharide/colanic/teichoic acid biosynthesis glycosyltransferase
LRRPDTDFSRTTVSGFVRDIEGWSPDAGVYSRILRAVFCFGYRPTNDVRHRIWNVSVAAALLLVTLPLFVVLLVTIALDSGRPVIYKGLRLGKDRKPFNIYKFRTLKPQAKGVTANQVLPERSSLETRTGKILRETRLDELPQLWNVIKGDMNLFGPRPVRREIAELYAAQIPNYEARFSVKPGLIGHVQTFMPHRAPKRLRASYNYKLIRRPTSPWKEVVFAAMVSFVALAKLGSMLTKRLGLVLRRGQIQELRATQRATPQHVTVQMVNADKKLVPIGQLQDINDEAFSFWSDVDLKESPDQKNPYRIVLQRRTPITGKHRRAVCDVSVKRVSYLRNGAANGTKGAHLESHLYLAKYVPVSEFHGCLIDLYFANRSFISL